LGETWIDSAVTGWGCVVCVEDNVKEAEKGGALIGVAISSGRCVGGVQLASEHKK
jgi:hypothetical protein